MITLHHNNGLHDNKTETKKRKTIEKVFRSERKRQGKEATTLTNFVGRNILIS